MTNKTVKPGVNSKALLSNLKHMFASGYSILGEMLQNARRAGAKTIRIEHDPEANTLTVIDDGEGITDFAKLVMLCESGWSEEVSVKDNPFGMGVFSLFFACESVTFHSGYQKLKVNIGDVVNTKTLHVEQTHEHVSGTKIALRALASEIANPKEMVAKVGAFARGFPVPVTFNGTAVKQDHALDGEKFNRFGPLQFSIPGMREKSTFGEFFPYHSSFSRNYACYLQGLPIETQDRYAAENPKVVVHLDTVEFTPQMPDRAMLYNSSEQRAKIESLFKDWIKQQLATAKDKLPPQEFIHQHWDDCLAFSKTLVNDIPWVPSNVFNSVDVLHYESFGWRNSDKCLISAQDITSGVFKAWQKTPSAAEEPHAGPILRVMQIEKIAYLWQNDLDQGHWLLKALPDASRFSATVTTSGECGHAHIGWNAEIEAVLVEKISIEITSDFDPAFKQVCEVKDSWVLVGGNAANYESDDAEWYDCYFTKVDQSPDHPLTFVESFMDEHDHHREDWENEAIADADRKLAVLRGASFGSLICNQINDLTVPLSERHVGSFVVTGIHSRYNEYLEKYQIEHRAVEMKETDWDKMAANLEVTPLALKAAFTEALGLKAFEGGPNDPDWVVAQNKKSKTKPQKKSKATA
jgi:hypothetical protein